MDLIVYLVAIVLAISSAVCDTGSNQQISDVSKEMKLLKDEMMSLRTQLNYEKTARIDLDRDLTEMTQKYRKLSIEFDEQLKTKIEMERNFTESKYHQLTENIDSNRNYTDSRHEELLSKMREMNTLSANSMNQMESNLTKISKSASTGRQSFFTASVNSNPGSINSKKVPFNNVFSRQGTEYDSTTGVYTAAEDGLYVFYVNIMVYYNKRCEGYISKDGRSVGKFLSDGSDASGGNYQMGGNMVVLNLVKGDKVWIQTNNCNYIYSAKYSTFAGFKIA